MNAAVLRGCDHEILGAVAAVGEGPVAVALSRGGARKRYAHTDPNEDAAGFFEGPAGLLLAVADGHGGHRGAAVAVESIGARAPEWTAADAPTLREGWGELARAALFDACAAVQAEGSPTTLALALLRPADRLLAFASIGDSHVFLVGEHDATDLARGEPGPVAFLGHPNETRESLAGKCVTGAHSSDGAMALALVTDGLSERGIGVASPSAAVAEAARSARERVAAERDRLALETARGIVDAALAAQRRNKAGDNVATAVAWLERGRS